jgi:D-alanine-D-alanine ligase
MRILVLHSAVPPDAPPEEADTLIAAAAIEAALAAHGHDACRAGYRRDRPGLQALLQAHAPDIVFNLVESVDGLGALAPEAPRALSELGWRFTGVGAEAMAITNDKPRAKAVLRRAGLATPDWCVPPEWTGLDDRTWIVKSALEDASLGLDDGCVVRGAQAAKVRAQTCAARYEGAWFAEVFVPGREFNIAMLNGRVLPIAEMRFEGWPAGKPRIVGYDAKWQEASIGWNGTVRAFGVERDEPALAAALRQSCERIWTLFGLAGFARVDVRVAEGGAPQILEINANPCLTPGAGFAAAAAQAGMRYGDMIEALVRAA